MNETQEAFYRSKDFCTSVLGMNSLNLSYCVKNILKKEVLKENKTTDHKPCENQMLFNNGRYMRYKELLRI